MLEKSYNAILSESYDYFQSQGVSIIGEGYKEIATNASLFESYVETLTEGASANDAAVMAQLMANTNTGILQESSITGIQPVASLSMPVIRKLWPKFALKEALKTEVAKSPRFVVSYTKPYMFKGDGEKIYLPAGLKDGQLGDNASDAIKKTYVAVSKTVDVDAAVVAEAVLSEEQQISTPSAAKKQPYDELIIVSVQVQGAAKAETLYNTALSVTGSRVIDLKKGQLIVQFDPAGKATLAYVGGDASSKLDVELKFGMSTEYNEDSYSVSFDIAREDIVIPTGTHINAPLPIEALNDMMALYQIDGTKETVDLMTNIFAMKLDLEVLDFIEKSFANQPGSVAFKDNADSTAFSATFDCIPAAGFAGSPKAWREELKPMIDFVATSIKNATYLQNGIFTIVGNPLDINLITNVDWNFRGGAASAIDGVEVDYSIGTYVNSNTYKVIASTNVSQGMIFIVFTPSADTQMTYKYYPYTFSTEMGYVDPNRSRVPSIMMTKRHQFHEFMPAIGCITIANNNGSPYREHIPTSTWTEA